MHCLCVYLIIALLSVSMYEFCKLLNHNAHDYCGMQSGMAFVGLVFNYTVHAAGGAGEQ